MATWAFVGVLFALLGSAIAELSARTMSAHGLMGCEDAPYVARRLLRNSDDNRQAISHLRKVLAFEESCEKAHFELGLILKEAGDVASAHEHLERVYVLMRNKTADGPGIDWYATPLEIQEMVPAYKSSKTKMQHDAQQLAFLLQHDLLGQGAHCDA